ncbi:unnamed protein product [Cochlearia groenlandica]
MSKKSQDSAKQITETMKKKGQIAISEESATNFEEIYERLESYQLKFAEQEEDRDKMHREMREIGSVILGIRSQLEKMNQSSNGDSRLRHEEVSTGENRSNQTLPKQVPIPNSEPNRNFSGLGNKDRLLKKVEMPIFEGTNTYSWLARAERFFRLGGYDDREKRDLVSITLAGGLESSKRVVICFITSSNLYKAH